MISADITQYFILFAPDWSDDLIISLMCIHFYPGSNLNLFCAVASHSPARTLLSSWGTPFILPRPLYFQHHYKLLKILYLPCSEHSHWHQ